MTVHRPVWAKPFLAALARVGVIKVACEVAGVARSSVGNLRRADPSFEQDMLDAMEDATDAMELAARTRAIEGVPKPVYQGGELVGHVQEYSDSLMALLLKGNRARYGTRRTEITGPAGGPVALDADTRANRIAELLKRAADRRSDAQGPSEPDAWDDFV